VHIHVCVPLHTSLYLTCPLCLGRVDSPGDPETSAHKAESKCPVSPSPRLSLTDERCCAEANRGVVVLKLTEVLCAQVVSRGEKLYYEITAGEHNQLVSPDSVAKLVLEKMRGTVTSPHKANAVLASAVDAHG